MSETPSKTIPVSLASVAASNNAAMCKLWKVRRRDDTTFHLTDWDQPVKYGGETYEPMDAFESSATEMSGGIQETSQQAVGFLSSETITEDDLIKGLYDQATIDEIAISPYHPWAGYFYWRRYYVEGTQFLRGRFELSIADLSYKLQTVVGDQYTNLCNDELGEQHGTTLAGCKYDLTNGTHTGLIVSAQTRVRMGFSSNASQADKYFEFGSVEWTSGANKGTKQNVAVFSGGEFTLLDEAPFSIETGDIFTGVVGCSKDFDTCRNKFSQGANFQGFPFIPGTDVVYTTRDAK